MEEIGGIDKMVAVTMDKIIELYNGIDVESKKVLESLLNDYRTAEYIEGENQVFDALMALVDNGIFKSEEVIHPASAPTMPELKNFSRILNELDQTSGIDLPAGADNEAVNSLEYIFHERNSDGSPGCGYYIAKTNCDNLGDHMGRDGSYTTRPTCPGCQKEWSWNCIGFVAASPFHTTWQRESTRKVR